MSIDNLDDYAANLTSDYAKVVYLKGYEKGLAKGKEIAVKHGNWIDTGRADYYLNKEYRCSCCDAVDYMRSNYCPNCGAKMEEERTQDET